MDAFDVMTTAVVTVKANVRIPKIAALLLQHNISAVPVVDETGAVIGMVSEGDLLRFSAEDRRERRDWWLAMLADGEIPASEYLASLNGHRRTAREIMSAPVVTVTERTAVAEIGKLLATHRIKRVPVIRDGYIIGIVSRADLIAALTKLDAKPAPHRQRRLFSWGAHRQQAKAHTEPKQRLLETAPLATEKGFTASDFRSLVSEAESKRVARLDAARKATAGRRALDVGQAIDHSISDEHWRGLLHEAQAAAQRGNRELLVLRFPSASCSDGGRAINVPEPDWPATLRGEAAETFSRFERELKPLGFHLIARVLDFPGGFIGDIGLFLHWGGTS